MSHELDEWTPVTSMRGAGEEVGINQFDDMAAALQRAMPETISEVEEVIGKVDRGDTTPSLGAVALQEIEAAA